VNKLIWWVFLPFRLVIASILFLVVIVVTANWDDAHEVAYSVVRGEM
jgi:hypothetical protein